MLQGQKAYQDTAPVKETTLSTDANALAERLQNILETVINIGNQLYGPAPHSAEGGASTEAIPSLRRSLDRSHAVASEIEGELQRIQHRI